MSKVTMFTGTNSALRRELETFSNKKGINIKSAQLNKNRAIVIYEETSEEKSKANGEVEIKVADHTGVDKSFEMKVNDTRLYFDFDDVNHPKVEAMAKTVEFILKMNWDEERFQRNWATELQKQFSNLTPVEAEEYDYDFEKFLKESGCTY